MGVLLAVLHQMVLHLGPVLVVHCEAIRTVFLVSPFILYLMVGRLDLVQWLVNNRGNPWVKISYPHPYPPKPIPLLRGMGFGGYG
jgi:hypothetical protein